MLPFMRASFMLFFVLMTSGTANALLAPERPAEGQFIADTVDMISDDNEQALHNISAQLFLDRKIPIVIVTIESLLHYTDGEYLGIEEYSKRLFKHWGIGSSVHKYGVLLLVSRDDGLARIQVGGGWGFLYNEQVQKIMKETIFPRFRKGELQGGFLAGVTQIDKLARTEFELLYDKIKIALLVFVFVLIVSPVTWLMIMHMNEPFLRFQWYFALTVSSTAVLIWFAHILSGLNYIEMVILLLYCLAVTLISLLVYLPFYARKHLLRDTLIHLAMILILIVFAPAKILYDLFMWHSKRDYWYHERRR